MAFLWQQDIELLCFEMFHSPQSPLVKYSQPICDFTDILKSLISRALDVPLTPILPQNMFKMYSSSHWSQLYNIPNYECWLFAQISFPLFSA